MTVLLKMPGYVFLLLSLYSSNPTTLYTEQPEQALLRKTEKALSFLKANCGEDGIKKAVLIKGGETIFKGPEADIAQNVWSCTKTFTSTVLGLLIAEGKCSLDSKVSDFLPELKDHYPELTFRHFATHTSGYKAAGDKTAGGHGQSSTPFTPSSDPLFAPGSAFKYWDSAMNVFAKALTMVAGEPLEDYFKRKVAEPISMDDDKWGWKNFGIIDGVIVNGGAGNKGRGIFISASEMAKLGQLYLNKGSWNGRQIISENWVKEATQPQIHKIISDENIPYGFNWWTSDIFPDAPAGTFAAKGFNNNLCIVIPELELIIVRLGLDGNIDDQIWNQFIKLLMQIDWKQ